MAAQTMVSMTFESRRGPMQKMPTATHLLAALVITGLLAGGVCTMATAQGQPKEALTADEAITCIRTAMAAQPGFIKEVEGDEDGGKRLCEVKIVDEAGKRHKLHIDLQTNQVVKTR
jgi:hypothetical protein